MPLQQPISSTLFAEALADRLNHALDESLNKELTPTQARTVIRTLHNLVLDTVTEGHDVVIWGFGRYYLRYHGNNMAEESGNPVKYTALSLRNSHKVRDYLTACCPAPEVVKQRKTQESDTVSGSNQQG